MKSVSELTNFYYKKLYPTLEKLEDERKKLKSKLISFFIIYTIAVLLLLLLFFKTMDIFALLITTVVLLVVGNSFIYKFFVKDYAKEFKQQIIAPLIKEVDRNLKYTPELHVPERFYRRSKIFTQSADRISGNDYVRGQIDGINIQFSDLHVEKEERDSKGNREWRTIFLGLFIVSEFNKKFKGETIILPDTAQNLFGDMIGSWLQNKNFSRGELIKMDNPAFEKEFVVYGSDQIEARYILTHSLMQKLLNFRKKTQHPIYLSFIHNDIHIAIAYFKDLFEPSVFHSLLEYKIAMEYVETLHLAIGIVEELKLNQKLWSKV
ncbi:DUF3137 domain-containing protein [Sulfurimonas sp.]